MFSSRRRPSEAEPAVKVEAQHDLDSLEGETELVRAKEKTTAPRNQRPVDIETTGKQEEKQGWV